MAASAYLSRLNRSLVLSAVLVQMTAASYAASSTTTLTAVPSPAAYPQATTFVATIEGTGAGAVSGTVTFTRGVTTLDRVAVSAVGASQALVAVGRKHACAVMVTGTVKCWGSNRRGQLGDPSFLRPNSASPIEVTDVAGAVAVTAGFSRSCALLDTGAVKCWGTGYGATATPVPDLTNVRAIAGGSFHHCALTDAGAVKCWGFNLRGQLGDGSTRIALTPVDVIGLDSGVVAIAAGAGHSCALTHRGVVQCWGDNVYGQLGRGR